MADVKTGRIIRSISGFYDVRVGDKTVSCRARGILRKEGCSPLTGDMVRLSVERSKGMIATKGRASYLGERSLGHQDPGATSFTLLLGVIAKYCG